MSHTPGPLKVQYIQGEEHDWYQIEDQKGNKIARIYINGDFEKAKANAHLLAAAPNMYQALLDLLDTMFESTEHEQQYKAGCIAIAKAKEKESLNLNT